ncbi:MAG: translation initiation factor IF-2 [Thermoplasmatota archaeon]
MSDDRTEEERLADEMAAELEAEFADHFDDVEETTAEPEEEHDPYDDGLFDEPDEAPAPAAEPKDDTIQVSEEAIAKAKAAAKGAKEGDADKALGALSAKSDKGYTRHPIVSVLGHVDHGKTSILDRIRGTKVFDREAGAITQHIGASEVPMETIHERAGKLLAGKNFGVPGLLCIDTPGHHAFSSLRGRGGQLADIAVLVVDLNEGFKPQTLESLNILKRAKTPFVVAANKVDRIEGWQTGDKPFILNVREQRDDVLARFDEKFYTLIGAFYDQGMPAERYDRVDDFTKNIAIVPTCATSGEGISDLLAMLVGLAQKFLEDRLETDEELPGEGTVLEVKEDKGLGQALDVVLYAGSIRSGDRVLLGTQGEPVETTIRALLKPSPNDDMRDARKAFEDADEIVAAAGIKLICPNAEDVVSGAPLRVLREDNEEEAWAAVEAASRINIPLDDTGLYIKADTIGSLEALAGELKAHGMRIRNAAVGDISRRDVIEAAAMTDPTQRALLGFNVKLLPGVETEADERELPVFVSKVIYTLMDEHGEWLAETQRRIAAEQRKEYIHPAKVRFLPGCSFRQRDPAVFGVRILGGQVMPGRPLVRQDGRQIGRIQSIQKESRTVTVAKLGDEVALSVPGLTLGRQIKEDDILYMDIPEGDAKWLLRQGNLSTDEREVLEELAATKRKEDKFWAM